jgi:hypothetical protein
MGDAAAARQKSHRNRLALSFSSSFQNLSRHSRERGNQAQTEGLSPRYARRRGRKKYVAAMRLLLDSRVRGN